MATWEDELEMKTSLQIYKKKLMTGEEEMYDNRPSSTILYKARTNTLQLNDRNRHTNKEIHCLVCDTDDKEDIYHFMLHCTRYVKLLVRSSKLLRHYFCARESQLHKKVKLQERPISLFVNRSRSFMDQ